jgi:hypothetical protein
MVAGQMEQASAACNSGGSGPNALESVEPSSSLAQSGSCIHGHLVGKNAAAHGRLEYLRDAEFPYATRAVSVVETPILQGVEFDGKLAHRLKLHGSSAAFLAASGILFVRRRQCALDGSQGTLPSIFFLGLGPTRCWLRTRLGFFELPLAPAPDLLRAGVVNGVVAYLWSRGDGGEDEEEEEEDDDERLTGKPRWARWARSWWRRPVSGKQRTRLSCPLLLSFVLPLHARTRKKYVTQSRAGPTPARPRPRARPIVSGVCT